MNNSFQQIIDALDWRTPYRASKGENQYYVPRSDFEQKVVHIIFDGALELETSKSKYLLEERGPEFILFRFDK